MSGFAFAPLAIVGTIRGGRRQDDHHKDDGPRRSLPDRVKIDAIR
jgi:hypothetical protein